MRRRDIAGQKFNKLTVIEKAPNAKNGKTQWLCQCDCGNRAIIITGRIINGQNKGCGCGRGGNNKTHGLSKTPEYRVWNGMIDRTTNPKAAAYDRYGGRGITVCDRWLKFENFLKDMGERPNNLTIDRIDNDKGYFLNNCEWSTIADQSRNKSTNRFITIDGVTKILNDWFKESPLCVMTFYNRQKKGFSERVSLGL